MKDNSLRWIYLAHLGYNMWLEPKLDKLGIPGQPGWTDGTNACCHLRFDEELWHGITAQLKEAGCNTILLDIGEGIKYESHPELSLEDSWSKNKLSDELDRLRGMGFEVLPKLNFSAAHDYWLGEYARMLSTSVYYRVVRDVITEVAELFGTPALFHLGMDEETYENQRLNNYLVIRQNGQWWYDFGKLINAVEDAGCRPWIWSDYAWHYEDAFFANMPRDVVQSNWYYGGFDRNEPAPAVRMYEKLSQHGYDQIPTGSNWSMAENMEETVKFCDDTIGDEHLLGYMQTPWYQTTSDKRERHEEAISCLAEAVKAHNER